MYRIRIFSKKAIGSTIRKLGKAALNPWYYLGKKAGEFIYEIEINDLECLNFLNNCRFEIKRRTF